MDDSAKREGQKPGEPEIAAADWLLQDQGSDADKPSRKPAVAPTTNESFELADRPETIRPVALPPFERRDETGSRTPRAPRASLSPGPLVSQVWSRGAEWGPSLVILAAWSMAMLWFVYTMLSAEYYSVAAVAFMAGILGAVVLSYPMLITLERPVRVTPEQAARDYYGALSHHLPHYRRMWLLLSNRGRLSSKFGSYEGFKAYWKQRLQTLRQGNASHLSPLIFLVEDFRSEKSAGLTEINARFMVKVFVRGRRGEGPIWSLPVESGFGKGPDGMWYLDEGTLADRSG
jgi:hypothetical protein